jgi:hypothetical protein
MSFEQRDDKSHATTPRELSPRNIPDASSLVFNIVDKVQFSLKDTVSILICTMTQVPQKDIARSQSWTVLQQAAQIVPGQ